MGRRVRVLMIGDGDLGIYCVVCLQYNLMKYDCLYRVCFTNGELRFRSMAGKLICLALRLTVV